MVGTWVASVGTVAAFGVAFIAIRRQSVEWLNAAEVDRRRHAEGVSVKASRVPRAHPDGTEYYPVTIHNPTPWPIFDCHLWWGASSGSLGQVLAGTSLKSSTLDDTRDHVDIGFTDSTGRTWARRWTGSLLEIPGPLGIVLGGPQWYEVAEYLDPLPRESTRPPKLTTEVESYLFATGRSDLVRKGASSSTAHPALRAAAVLVGCALVGTIADPPWAWRGAAVALAWAAVGLTFAAGWVLRR